MSYLGRKEDAIREANAATKIIDGEDFTSPIRDGSSSVEAGGVSFDHGTAEFDNHEQHGRPIKNQGSSLRRQYGQEHKVSPK